jgi:hypothetical protein
MHLFRLFNCETAKGSVLGVVNVFLLLLWSTQLIAQSNFVIVNKTKKGVNHYGLLIGGKKVVKPIYDSLVSFEGNFFGYLYNKKWGLISRNGTIISEAIFTKLELFTPQLMLVEQTQQNRGVEYKLINHIGINVAKEPLMSVVKLSEQHALLRTFSGRSFELFQFNSKGSLYALNQSFDTIKIVNSSISLLYQKYTTDCSNNDQFCVYDNRKKEVSGTFFCENEPNYAPFQQLRDTKGQHYIIFEDYSLSKPYTFVQKYSNGFIVKNKALTIWLSPSGRELVTTRGELTVNNWLVLKQHGKSYQLYDIGGELLKDSLDYGRLYQRNDFACVKWAKDSVYSVYYQNKLFRDAPVSEPVIICNNGYVIVIRDGKYRFLNQEANYVGGEFDILLMQQIKYHKAENLANLLINMSTLFIPAITSKEGHGMNNKSLETVTMVHHQFYNNKVVVTTKNRLSNDPFDYNFGFMDTNGLVKWMPYINLVPLENGGYIYEDKKTTKIGLLNTEGEVLVPAKYSSIKQITGNFFVVESGNKADSKMLTQLKEGNLVNVIKLSGLEKIYDNYYAINKTVFGPFALVRIDDNALVFVTSFEYEKLSYLGHKLVSASKGFDKKGVIDLEGREVISLNNRMINPFFNHKAEIINSSNEKFFIDTSGKRLNE